MPSVGVVWVLSSEAHTHNSIDTQSLSSTHTHSTLPERERRRTGAEAIAEPASPATPSVSLTTPTTLVNLSAALTSAYTAVVMAT